MGVWFDRGEDEWAHFETPCWPEVTVTEPEVIATLLGPDGEPIIQFLDREPIGFRLR